MICRLLPNHAGFKFFLVLVGFGLFWDLAQSHQFRGALQHQKLGVGHHSGAIEASEGHMEEERHRLYEDTLNKRNFKEEKILDLPGIFGCRMKPDLCKDEEFCLDDGLFGVCRKTGDHTQLLGYQLDRGQVRQLERVMKWLVMKGLTWDDSTTQCTIGITLLSFDTDIPPPYTLCSSLDGKMDFYNEEMKPLLSPKVGSFDNSGRFEGNIDKQIKSASKRYGNGFMARHINREGARLGVHHLNSMLKSEDKMYRHVSQKYLHTSISRYHKARQFNIFHEAIAKEPEDTQGAISSLRAKEEEEEKDKVDKPVKNTGELEAIEGSRFRILNTAFAYITLEPRLIGQSINFLVKSSDPNITAESIASSAMAMSSDLHRMTGFHIIGAGVGRLEETSLSIEEAQMSGRSRYFILLLVIGGVVSGLLLAAVALYLIRKFFASNEKLAHLDKFDDNLKEKKSQKDYEELCRVRKISNHSEKADMSQLLNRFSSYSTAGSDSNHQKTPSSRSSTSSWSEEPVSANMDISTGHLILSYMEDYLSDKSRLDKEWESLETYQPEPNSVSIATLRVNNTKNRYPDILPYDHSRVVLTASLNLQKRDYINASTIMDHDPRNPAYILAQGPLDYSVSDFWQMVWEQGCVVIVNLTRLEENSIHMCDCYWPVEGSMIYHIFEINLVSEHMWCEDFVIRSFYLKNLMTNETRTVTQFHFTSWPENGVPTSVKSLLDFRRKVNKSYRGRSCPILIHCNDGAGRSGTYCLIDLVLNRISKGVKEIDMSATLEHIRDQRMLTVKTKEQYQFALSAVAEEVHAILRAVTQAA